MTAGPAVLALDFDGVLCDGRAEYFEASRRAYREAWPGAREVPDAAAAPFGAYRPLVESGWEMPALLHAVVAGEPAAALVDRAAWLVTARRLLAAAGLVPETLGRALNGVRDAWFARDPDDWVRHNAFYPGVVTRLVETLGTSTPVAIVTTKAERFARTLLAAQDARLAALPVVGREPGRTVPKPETLLRLSAAHSLQAGGEGLWFVEDLLETLEAVHATPGLDRARLFLAAWGYNTLEQRAFVGGRGPVRLLSLGAWAAPFAAWPR
ncbi:MAG TPA: HAD family hydrolase [Methylomirabilota bacterium]|jgi:phosphoglycolate phosphatase-like HAD superfamily hydrolase|nr:HAD family hydrolase [Methylomirabilota bacterium]